MKFFEDRLEALDAYFERKSPTERWVIILGVAAIIAYVAYMLLLPYAQEKYESSKKAKERLEKKIAEHRQYLASITRNGDRDYKVKSLTKEIIEKEKGLEQLKRRLALIDNSLLKLSDLLFNQATWSKFLDSLSDKATVQEVEIDKIVNQFVDSNGSFGHVLKIDIKARGEYKSLIKFMNELEQSILVTDLYATELSLEQNQTQLTADINLSVWGINH